MLAVCFSISCTQAMRAAVRRYIITTFCIIWSRALPDENDDDDAPQDSSSHSPPSIAQPRHVPQRTRRLVLLSSYSACVRRVFLRVYLVACVYLCLNCPTIFVIFITLHEHTNTNIVMNGNLSKSGSNLI